MALVATAVGPDHFVGAVSIPVSLMSRPADDRLSSGRLLMLVRWVTDIHTVDNVRLSVR